MAFTQEETSKGYKLNTPNAGRLINALRHITKGLTPKKEVCDSSCARQKELFGFCNHTA